MSAPIHIRELLFGLLEALGCKFRGPLEPDHEELARLLERVDAEPPS